MRQLQQGPTGDRRGKTVYPRMLTFGQNYRYWVIWRCPSVRYFDFAKVRDMERKKATELFGTAEEPTELASKVCGPGAVVGRLSRAMLITLRHTDHGSQVKGFRCTFFRQWRRWLKQGPHLHRRREEAHASCHPQCEQSGGDGEAGKGLCRGEDTSSYPRGWRCYGDVAPRGFGGFEATAYDYP